MGKTVIVVGDRPGFWVNRILAPYLGEAGRLVLEGVPLEAIDRVMVRFGFPVGPVTLLDEVGLDVAAKGAVVMHEAFGDRMAPSPAFVRLVEAGYLGRKAGRGFFLYADGRKGEPDPRVYEMLGVKPLAAVDEADVERRLAYALLNEAARAEAEGVVRQPRDGDIGAIFGPPAPDRRPRRGRRGAHARRAGRRPRPAVRALRSAGGTGRLRDALPGGLTRPAGRRAG
jgi:3-hydroxyacyl-CoA dehydrogenase / enoyl-CoA hydratase / 3-hydroxybutyryl-CoA epimerase